MTLQNLFVCPFVSNIFLYIDSAYFTWYWSSFGFFIYIIIYIFNVFLPAFVINLL